MRTLEQCRLDIDSIDKQLLQLLSKRLEVAADIAQYKIDHNQGIVDKKREHSKIDSLINEAVALGVPSTMAAEIFTAVMSHTVSFEQSYIVQKANEGTLERSTSIAYLGSVIGTYSHLAALRFTSHYRGQVTMKGCGSFEEIVAAVRSGEVEYGLLPVENSSSGTINEASDLLSRSEASLVGEVILPIDHSLLTLPEAKAADITTIYSHPQPIAQCSKFLKERFPKAEIIYTSSTSDAMDKVRQSGDLTCAAIASMHSARFYGLSVQESDIANHKSNYTRFVVLSMTSVRVPLNLKAKTSLIFTTKKYEPGSLIKVLAEFSSRGINLTKLHSRPTESDHKDIWEELFFADVEANLDTPVMQQILSELKDLTGYLRVLGCYAQADQEPHS